MGQPALGQTVGSDTAGRTSTSSTVGAPIDWGVAAARAHRLLPTGPAVAADEAALTVRRLRDLATTAEGHVRELTGMDDGLPPQPAEVVDRRGWVEAAVGGLRLLLAGDAAGPVEGGIARRVLARTAGMQIGVALAFLGSRVLGQYDPFGEAVASDLSARPRVSEGSARPTATQGNLLLVAPNMVNVQRALEVPADDFQMWVCLHEATHRLQFNAVPWLRAHFATQVQAFISATEDPESLAGMLSRLPAALRGARRGEAGGSSDALAVLTLLQSPEQRAVLDRLLALATLLEGHADHVMDAVGPDVVPSVRLIRQRFTVRRQGGGIAERVMRALLGVDAKLRQYAEGAAFTRHVVDAVGMAGFNAVWTSPETLPTRAEIIDPAAWLRRV
ncbi:MAG TPA: zinc-dependent metalloprotease [Pseudonocardiaceae bacterium]|nr:zinc-dependent metalloprotease [Pseudonocardiaceae bacterium]